MITVFTPAYNRAHLLHVLYNSLKNQTSFNFEWLIVDDGSKDNTKEVVDGFINECDKFQIRYYFQENHGKHVAINYGVQLAQGDKFFIVDSDDWLSSDAIEKIHIFFEEIRGFEDFAGVAGLKLYGNGELVGTTFDKEYVDCTSLERLKYKINGDKAEVFYTNVLKNYPFPVFEGENFLGESVVWYRIANDGYKIRWFNEGIYFCEYLEGGLSSTSNLCYKNFNGFKLSIKEALTYKEISRKRKIINLMIIGDISIRRKEKLKEIAKEIGVNYLRFAFWAHVGRIIRKIRHMRRKNGQG